MKNTRNTFLLIWICVLAGCSDGFLLSEQDKLTQCNAQQNGERYFDTGTLSTGDAAVYPEEHGKNTFKIAPFKIDKTEVTNKQFSKFVEETGYLTRAERGLTRDVTPGLSEESYKLLWLN
jgi:hypothetical protein